MSRSPYENSIFETAGPGDPVDQMLEHWADPPAIRRNMIPAGRREVGFALVMIILSCMAVNFTVYGGFRLGYAIGALCIMLATFFYLLSVGVHWNAYGLICVVGAMVLSAAFARMDDHIVKFFLLPWTLLVYFLGLSRLAGVGLRKDSSFASLLDAGRSGFSLPYPAISACLRGLFSQQTEHGTRKRKWGGILLGLLLAIPALAVLLPLLMQSDAAFEGLIRRTFLSDASEFLVTLLFGALLFLPLYARGIVLGRAHMEEPETRGRRGGLSPITLHAFLAAISFFYLLYLLSQLAYFFGAFQGILPDGYTMAEYARRGFFEMSIVCVINLGLVILAIGYVKRDPGIPKLTKGLCLFICLFSLVLVACSVSKMALYIGAYGLTRLRLLTSLFMACVAVALMAATVQLFAPRFPAGKLLVCAVLVVGCIAGWMDVDTQVARYNVNAYLTGRLETVDIQHLSQLSDGATIYLARLMDSSDEEVRASARAAMAMEISEVYHVTIRGTENEATVLLTPRRASDWRSWTFTASQSDHILAEAAQNLIPELQAYAADGDR